ncbi:MAG: glycosyltransferase N-terminal domain-containing protein [Gemmatimonas sp.]
MVRLASSTLAIVAPNHRGKLSRTLIARAGLLERWTADVHRVRDRSRPLVWFHAPSVGEGLQARPIIEALQRARPDVQIAYSFFSPSAESFAQSLKVDVAGYLPFDSTYDAHELIAALSPTALFFVKLDVWPTLVSVAKRNGVFVGLLSGTVAPSSGRQGALSRIILRDAYAALDVVGAIDKKNGDRLVGLGVASSRLSVSGDTRFDQVWKRAEGVDRASVLLRALQSSQPTVVAGSTWPADETVLLAAWTDVKRRIPNARLIIAPHEPTPEHLQPILAWAHGRHLSVALLGEVLAARGHVQSMQNTVHAESSDSHAVPDSVDVVIVDRVGVLGDIYALADVAYVGGAFHKAGLHSVLEPAAFGAPVVFGPRYAMSREAGLLLECGGAVSASSIAECARALGAWLTDTSMRNDAGARASAFVESELGAADRSLRLVLGALA